MFVRVRARVVAIAPGSWVCLCGCVPVALLIRPAILIRLILLSFVAPLAPPHFSTLSHKRPDFRKKLLSIKCVF